MLLLFSVIYLSISNDMFTTFIDKRKNDALTVELRKGQGSSTDISGSQEIIYEENLANAKDLPLFNYNLVASATNFFSMENKLGEGGFGPVYKVISYEK